MDPNQKAKIEGYQSKRCAKIRRMAQKAHQKESK